MKLIKAVTAEENPDNTPVLKLTIEVKPGVVLGASLLNGMTGNTAAAAGLTFLGPEWEGRVSATVPKDPGDSRPDPVVVKGATDDPQVHHAMVSFAGLINSGQFKPGIVVFSDK